MKHITLREARKRAKLTQVELATAAGVDQTTISDIETARVENPSFDTVVKIAGALDIDPRILVFGREAVAP